MGSRLAICAICLAVASCGSKRSPGGDAGADVAADPAEEATGDGPDAEPDPLPDAGPDAEDVPEDVQDDAADVLYDVGDVLERGECTSSADCGGRPCVRVPNVPGGYWLCKVPERRETTECSSTDPWVDQCCDSFECIDGMNGGCFFSDWGWGFCGGGLMPHNVCVYDECSRTSDCTAHSPAVCVPRDVQDWPRRRCAYGTCRTSRDCTAEPGGFCAPLFDFCCDWRITGFFCIYPGECQYHTDCSSDLEGCVGDPSTGGTRCEVIHCPL
jgi:hypothetical protein